MKELSIKRAKLPVRLIFFSVLVNVAAYFVRILYYPAAALLIGAVISYINSCKCPYCRGGLKVAKLPDIGETYSSPHCDNKIKIVE